LGRSDSRQPGNPLAAAQPAVLDSVPDLGRPLGQLLAEFVNQDGGTEYQVLTHAPFDRAGLLYRAAADLA